MTGPCSCRPGMGVIFEEVKCAVKVALMLSGMHTVSRPGEEALAAACLPVSSCLNAVVLLNQTPVFASQ